MILVALASNLLYSYIINLAFSFFSPLPDMMATTLSGNAMTNSYAFGSALILAPTEELLFRIMPLTIALRKWGATFPTVIVLIVSSVIFGLAHGDPRNILVQGMGGVVYGILFIKFSNVGRRPVLAGCIVTAVHLAFDVLMLAAVVLGGGGW